MSVLTLADLKAHLNLTTDDDDALLGGKIAAAESYIGSFVGGDLATVFPSGVPAAVLEAVRQLAGHFYENREAVVSDERRVVVLPYGTEALIAPFRAWAF